MSYDTMGFYHDSKQLRLEKRELALFYSVEYQLALYVEDELYTASEHVKYNIDHETQQSWVRLVIEQNREGLRQRGVNVDKEYARFGGIVYI